MVKLGLAGMPRTFLINLEKIGAGKLGCGFRERSTEMTDGELGK